MRHGEVSVEQLADRFSTSAETIRRDLTVLSKAGQIRKIHGGAQAVSSHGEGVFDARMRHNTRAKHLLAEKIAATIKPRQSLFMDTGSTTLICAEVMAKTKNLTVITNSTRIAAVFAAGSGGAEVYLLGGKYRADNAQTVGSSTICEVGNYRADLAILTVAAIDANGAMDFSNQEAMVARAMCGAAAKVVVVADHSKFNKQAPFKICGLSDIDTFVADRPPSEALYGALLEAGVEVI